MSKLAIVTSCDERYAPLAKGLILSLVALGYPRPECQLCLLDIGCSDSTLRWMASHRVRTVQLEEERHIPFPTSHLPRHISAMAFRPFMQAVFPGFDTYMWIDSDAWVQQDASIQQYARLANDPQFDIAISPLIDVNYKLHYTAKEFRNDLERMYQAIFPDIGKELAWLPVLSAGVFAMRKDSPIWKVWGDSLSRVYRQDYRSVPDALHLAEQTALNHVVYLKGNPAFLDATHNYHLCAGAARWENNQLVIPHTNRLIGVVHLCAFRSNAETYLRGRALFQRGNYLGDRELEQLRQIRNK